MSSEEQEEEDEEEGGYEVSQFHTQDEAGRVVFGFHSPEHVRMEARNSDGTVRGSYSYVDPYGNIVKMQYWDDGTGFHAAGDHLPVAIYEAPQYTPEVKAAREEHFRLFEQAAAAAIEAGDGESSESDSNGRPYDEDYDSPPEDTMRIEENDFPPPREINAALSGQQQKYPMPQEMPLFPDQYLDDDKEAVSIDNPNFRAAFRRGKSQDIKLVSEGKKLQMKSRASPEARMESDMTLPKGFYYHYRHELPLSAATGQGDLVRSQSSSISRIAVDAGAIPPDAVHDAQVSPLQRVQIPNHQVLPVLDETVSVS